MTFEVVVSARANADTIEAFRWKAEHSAKVAARWLAGLEKALGKLGSFPERHPVAEADSEQLGVTLRQMVYGKKPGTYRLLFTIEGDTVTVHPIRHGARGPIEPEGTEGEIT